MKIPLKRCHFCCSFGHQHPYFAQVGVQLIKGFGRAFTKKRPFVAKAVANLWLGVVAMVVSILKLSSMTWMIWGYPHELETSK
jgi:hypothetical protein